jgi:DNA modification methylase
MPKSYKHPNDTRAHIPSKEEAGYENASPKVKGGAQVADYDKNPKYFQGNPVDHRGKDPELWWLDKYGRDTTDDRLRIDIRSLYRHEHIAPEKLIQGLYRTTMQLPKEEQLDMFADPNALFGNALEKDEMDKVSEYYRHSDGWSNRLIQGDSLLVMGSLLEREGMAGQVQCIYFDPPYGIKYGGNWQMKLNDRNVKDGADEHLSGEPEMIKAFRDTWELGIHSYLSYLRDRLIIARDLLTESGSCFVQISDENVHLVRCLMDEVFGGENFMSLITYQKSSPLLSTFLPSTSDYIVWYSKNKETAKYRQLFIEKKPGEEGASRYSKGFDKHGNIVAVAGYSGDIRDLKLFTDSDLSAQTASIKETFQFDFEGKSFFTSSGRLWQTHEDGMKRLAKLNRILVQGSRLRYIRYFDDFPVNPMIDIWTDIGGIQSRSDPKVYTVQTSTTAAQRCILMTTDPGDLVLDPTCGSGTTAYVAEQWGRRWITIDTSRIALNIAKTRLMTATYPYYHLNSDVEVAVDHKDGKIKKKITEKVDGGWWLVDSKELKVANYDNFKKLSGLESLDAINGLGDQDIRFYSLLSQRRDLWLDFADQEGGSERSGQHSGGAGTAGHQGVHSVSMRGPSFFGGSGDLDRHLATLGLSDPAKRRAYIERMRQYLEADERLDKFAKSANYRAPIHPLTTVHQPQIDSDIRQGFVYDEVPHITLKSLANDEPPSTETLYDRPMEDKKKLRVSGPFTVETLQNFEPISPSAMRGLERDNEDNESFQQLVFTHLRSAGVKNGIKEESVRFTRVEGIVSKYFHAEGFYNDADGRERKAYIYIGPKFGTVSKLAVNDAVKECRAKGDGDWLIILGFSFESDISSQSVTTSMGSFEVTKARMHDDLMQDGLLKKVKNAGSFITIGEPDVRLNKSGSEYQVEIAGLDIYDPIKDIVKARNVQDIAYWMVDTDYDGSNFVVKQVFFCGGDKDEFSKWQKGLSDMSKQTTKQKAEATLKIEIDEEAFDRLYGHISHPFEAQKGQKVAVRVISQFGEESMKVLEVR